MKSGNHIYMYVNSVGPIWPSHKFEVSEDWVCNFYPLILKGYFGDPFRVDEGLQYWQVLSCVSWVLTWVQVGDALFLFIVNSLTLTLFKQNISLYSASDDMCHGTLLSIIKTVPVNAHVNHIVSRLLAAHSVISQGASESGSYSCLCF